MKQVKVVHSVKFVVVQIISLIPVHLVFFADFANLHGSL